MVKNAIKAKFLSQKMINSDDDDAEEFIKADQYLENEALNDQEFLDDNITEERNEVLIEKLKSIDNKNRKKLRTEIVNDELDVNITTKSDANSVYKIKTHELLHSLKGASDAATLKKLFSKAHKRTKVLDTPAPKYITEKAQRVATYNEDKKEISEWDPVVKKNRRAEQMSFPLKQPDFSLQTSASFTKAWKPETDLEKQIADLLQTSENNLKNQKYLTEAELKAIKSLNLEDLKQKRAEFMKLKAMEKYQEAKFKRLKHIKSKRYRKILRKEKEKQEEKNLKNLEEDDPIKFNEVLDQIEKNRMKERMSLKHKNTSKWAKAQSRYAKYSDRAREQLQEQLEISKNLTKKVKQNENKRDSDEEDNKAEDKNINMNDQKINLTNLLTNSNGLLQNNPWIKMMGDVGVIKSTNNNEIDSHKNETSINNDYSRPQAYTDKKEIEKIKNDLGEASGDESFSEDELKFKSKHEDIIDIFKKDEQTESNNQQKNGVKLKKKKNVLQDEEPSKVVKLESINETKEKNNENEFKKEEKNMVPIESNKISDENVFKKSQDESEKHQITLSEAFADDDVIEEFKAEKKAIVEKEKVKSIDLTIPGWGEWAGAGVDLAQLNRRAKRNKNNKRYRRKLIIKPKDVLKTDEDKQQMIRQDKNLEHVIISEKKDTKIAQFQISELPHQFSNVIDFEKKISQPIGRTWNPEQKFRKLTLPKVKTKIGSIIKPIDKDDIIKNTRKSSSKK